MGKGKRADVYLEVRKRRGHMIYFLNETSACVIHDLRVYVLDHHFNSPFVYIDNRDFLRENGEVGLVLGIRERP